MIIYFHICNVYGLLIYIVYVYHTIKGSFLKEIENIKFATYFSLFTNQLVCFRIFEHTVKHLTLRIDTRQDK